MRTKYCSRCGSILEDGAEYCGECGAKVTDATDIADYGFTSPTQDEAPVSEVPTPVPDAAASAASSWQNGNVSSDAASQPAGQESSGHEGAGANDSWQSAGAFSNAPKAPDTTPPADYWQNGQQSGSSPYWQSGSQQGSYETPPQQNTYQNPNYGGNNSGYINGGGFQQINNPSPPPASGSQKTAVLILGVVAIVFGLLLPIISYPCAIIGLVLASKAKKNGENVQAGQVCCIIGLALAIINSVLGVLINLISIFTFNSYY